MQNIIWFVRHNRLILFLMICFIKIKSIDLPPSVILSVMPSDTRFVSLIQEPFPSFYWFSLFPDELLTIISRDCPPDYPEEFYSSYANLLMSVFYMACRDLNEIRHLVRPTLYQFYQWKQYTNLYGGVDWKDVMDQDLWKVYSLICQYTLLRIHGVLYFVLCNGSTTQDV